MAIAKLKVPFRSWKLTLLFVILSQVVSVPLEARQPEEAEFSAASVIGQRISEWIGDLETRPNSVGVFFVHANAPLEQDYANIVETEILKNLSTLELQSVMSCAECRNANVSVEQDRLVITRGTPDLETFTRIGRKISVETFIVVELYRTKISVIAQVVLYQNPSGTVLNAERFRVPAVNFSDSAAQVLLTIGPGKVLAGKAGVAAEVVPAAALSLLEELGFGKGGLTLGAVLGGNNGTLIYLTPTFGFRGRLGTSGMAWSLHLGLGYGFTPESKGLTVRSAFDLYLGSLAAIGLDTVYFLPDKTADTLKSYVGFHIGLSLGR